MEDQGPSDYRRALASVTVPLLVVVGERDEAFDARAFPGVLAEAGLAAPVIVSGATHDGIVSDARTMAAVRSWSRDAGLAPGAPSMR